MKLKITKQIPKWANVNKEKRVVIVEFPNCEFQWIPSYSQLDDIAEALKEIEKESWFIPIESKGGIKTHGN